jgi:hypothetical protein
MENSLATLTARRDVLAGQMITALEGAEFSGQPISQAQAQNLVAQAQAILASAHSL